MNPMVARIIEIMKFLQGSSNAVQDRYNFMKTVFLYWVLAAIDGHAKNFSIIIQPSGKYALAPLYDVISAYPLMINKQLDRKKAKWPWRCVAKTSIIIGRKFS